MVLISPDAFYMVHSARRATFECLQSFRRYNPNATVVMMSDAGDDFSDIATRFGCHYEYCSGNVCPPKPSTTDQLREWLGRFTRAARKGNAEFMILLEDDVLIRGPIERTTRFAVAGPWHRRARLSRRLIWALQQKWPHITARNYGACGGALFHRETFIEASEAFDFEQFPRWASLCPKAAAWTDAFLTLVFLLAGHTYTSAHDVFTETWYRGWETNGLPIVHQYKRFYGQPLIEEALRPM